MICAGHSTAAALIVAWKSTMMSTKRATALSRTLLLTLRPTAALQYQVANCDNNDKNGYDGHPVKSHRSGVLL